MEFHYFGHAMWLAEAAGTRVLFDPLLSGLHHGDVFEVEPERRVDVDALQPDFLIVSHAHGDHFDLRSLHALAVSDPDTVVFTSDEVVARACTRLGFREVSRVDTWSRIDLPGCRVLTTPSYAEGETEWGAMIAGDDAVVWNQIDSYHPELHQVDDTLARASKALDRDLTRTGSGPELAFVRWQPVMETQGPLGKAPGFPFNEYAMSLGRIAAIGAKAVVPSAAGVRQTAAYGWMNHYVYPVPHRRAERDIATRAPGTQVFPATIGATYRAAGRDVAYDPVGARGLVEVLSDFDPRNTLFRPYEMPPIVDPNVEGRPVDGMRGRVATWVEETLAPALAKQHPTFGVGRPLVFVLEVVFPGATDAFTLEVGATTRVTRTLDDDYDVLNSVAGSLLVDVIEGRRQWGDPLLGGMIRASSRAYDLNAEGLLVSPLDSTFLYYAIPYRESVERAIEYQLSQLCGRS